MTQSKHSCGLRQSINYHPGKPMLLAPVILSTEVIDGTKFYIGENNRRFESQAFDKMFKVERGVVLPMYSK